MSKKELRRKSILDLVKLGQLSQKDAAKRLSLSYCQVKRVYQRYLKEGAEGLVHQHRGKASTHAYPLEMKRLVLTLYEEKYRDFGPDIGRRKVSRGR